MAGKRFCNCWAMIVEKLGAPLTPPLTLSTFSLALLLVIPLTFNSSTRTSLPPLGPLPLLPLPTRSPVSPPRDSATGRPTLQVLILGGIIYTRENMGNVRFETYVKSKDLDLWHVITYGDFPPIQNNPETKKDEIVPFDKQNDDLKKKLAKNNEAKMVIYNALPRKEYESHPLFHQKRVDTY
ncbi:hypothetical protein Tco_0470764 [Tanacetum coccineum]